MLEQHVQLTGRLLLRHAGLQPSHHRQPPPVSGGEGRAVIETPGQEFGIVDERGPNVDSATRLDAKELGRSNSDNCKGHEVDGDVFADDVWAAPKLPRPITVANDCDARGASFFVFVVDGAAQNRRDT